MAANLFTAVIRVVGIIVGKAVCFDVSQYGIFNNHWGRWFPCQRALALHDMHIRNHTGELSKYLNQHPAADPLLTCLFLNNPSLSCCLHPFLLSFSRLLSQLDETERAFDEFWVRHQTKLEQCLQLRHFEHNYREVSRSLLAQVKSSMLEDYTWFLFKLQNWLRYFCRRWGLCWIRCLRNLGPTLRWGSAQPTLTISSLSSPPMRRESV